NSGKSSALAYSVKSISGTSISSNVSSTYFLVANSDNSSFISKLFLLVFSIFNSSDKLCISVGVSCFFTSGGTCLSIASFVRLGVIILPFASPFSASSFVLILGSICTVFLSVSLVPIILLVVLTSFKLSVKQW